MKYFIQEDIDFLKSWSGTTYDLNNPKHKEAARRLKDTVWNQTAYWAKEVSDSLGWVSDGVRQWGQRGYEEDHWVSKFKAYTWFKVRDPFCKDVQVFFTLGVDGGGDLLIKLDVKHSGRTKLPDDKLSKLKGRIFPYRYISVSEATSWSYLIEVTINFIKAFEGEYAALVREITGGDYQEKFKSKFVDYQSLEPKGLNELREPQVFYGNKQKDFLGLKKEKKRIGNKGEEFAFEVLLEQGKNKVQRLIDGNPVDLEYLEQGKKVYVEVKTTQGAFDTPIFMSKHEYEFLQVNRNNYKLFRIYDLCFESKTYNYTIIDGLDFLKQFNSAKQVERYSVSLVNGV